MAKGHPGLPKPESKVIRKLDILDQLHRIDAARDSCNRILHMENLFRVAIQGHILSLPAEDAVFQKFSTNPFVLMMHALKHHHSKISEIENSILPAKEFSSMETSAGRMAEEVTLPVYGWQTVPSGMHTANSALDGKALQGNTLRLVTLKSGPRCLNDEMSENFADQIINYLPAWVEQHGNGVTKVDFTYGVLYGTERMSNKKDWHILRNLMDKLPRDCFSVLPEGRWSCSFNLNGIEIEATIRIGEAWWHHLGGESCLLEVCVAMIRACVLPGEPDPADFAYSISDLGSIVSTQSVPGDFNVAILQRSQLPWLFFLLRHFCDAYAD